jgi:hypothetical protein
MAALSPTKIGSDLSNPAAKRPPVAGQARKNLGETPASPIHEKCCLEDAFFYIRNNAKPTNRTVNTSTKLTIKTRSKSFIRRPPRIVVSLPVE